MTLDDYEAMSAEFTEANIAFNRALAEGASDEEIDRLELDLFRRRRTLDEAYRALAEQADAGDE